MKFLWEQLGKEKEIKSILGLVGKATTCMAGILYGCCFLSRMLHFWYSFLLMAWVKHHKMETQWKLLDPGFSQASADYCCHLRNKPSDGRVLLFLFLLLFPTLHSSFHAFLPPFCVCVCVLSVALIFKINKSFKNNVFKSKNKFLQFSHIMIILYQNG